MEQPQETKKCYYELMNVKIDATQDEIKRSFKKLSLKYHPDKNRKNPEAAKLAFQEITEAYNCLSDEKERIWYDNNREKLLMNKDDMTHEELQIQSFGFDIFAYQDEDIFEGFGDDDEGFYAVYRKCFSMLDYEEERTYKFQTKLQDYQSLPSFGDSKSDIEDIVKFYESWSVFSTIKLFAWADQHDTRDGENRYEKRQMENDNEKLRRKEKKIYISTVKDLVAQIKKIDPRRDSIRELERQHAEAVLIQREQNKGEKQKKREQEQRLKEEKKKQLEEQKKKAFEEAEKKRLELIKQQQEQQAEVFVCKVCQKEFPTTKKLGDHKKSHKSDADDQKVYEELQQILKNGGTLSKKQQKEHKKFQLQEKAKLEKEKQKKLKEEKEKAAKQDQSKDQEDKQNQGEQNQEEEQNGDQQQKKRKRNKKKKNAQPVVEEKPVQEEKKPWLPQSNSEDEDKKEEQKEEDNTQQQQNEEEQWDCATGSNKVKTQIKKEVKKKQKAKDSDKRCDETKNIENNYFASVDDSHLKKVDRKQEQKQKKKIQEEEDSKFY